METLKLLPQASAGKYDLSKTPIFYVIENK
jgi:hypothetical protein